MTSASSCNPGSVSLSAVALRLPPARERSTVPAGESRQRSRCEFPPPLSPFPSSRLSLFCRTQRCPPRLGILPLLEALAPVLPSSCTAINARLVRL